MPFSFSAYTTGLNCCWFWNLSFGLNVILSEEGCCFEDGMSEVEIRLLSALPVDGICSLEALFEPTRLEFGDRAGSFNLRASACFCMLIPVGLFRLEPRPGPSSSPSLGTRKSVAD